MKDEIKEILVISNSPARDIQEFNKYCKSYIDKCESHKVYLKDGCILRFHSSHNLDGVRKYYLYHEIFESYLKNCITNLQTIEQQYSAVLSENAELQQENERLKENYEKEQYLVDKYTRQLTDEYKNTNYQCKQKEDYKSRCEKAIIELDDPFEDEDGDASWYEIAETYKEQIKEALNILQGSDKE